MFDASHGGICAALLPPVMQANINTLAERDPESPIRERFETIAKMLTDNPAASADDGVVWISETVTMLKIPPLRTYGITESDFPDIIEKSRNSSSMKGNPITLTDAELSGILQAAL
jgi:alcohol dehydrogenase class IV